MLFALNTNKEKIYAEQAVKTDNFICPGCNKPVILKKGDSKISHFAHKVTDKCLFAHGETEAHLKGKDFFYNLLKNQNINVELEVPLFNKNKDLIRIADILVYYDELRPIPIEIQNSALKEETLKKRIKDYKKAGCYALWIPLLKGDINYQNNSLMLPYETIKNYSPSKTERLLYDINILKQGCWYYRPEDNSMYLIKHIRNKINKTNILGDIEEKEFKIRTTLLVKGPYSFNDIYLKPIKIPGKNIYTHFIIPKDDPSWKDWGKF